MVMVFHYAVIGFHWQPESFFRLGRLGVELFFVISGIVIAMTATRATDSIDFFVRRFSRIYPTFIFCVTVTYVVTLFYDPAAQSVRFVDYIASLTLFGQRLGFKFVDGVYWSLAVELQFYGVVALGILALGRRFWAVVLGVLVVGAASRFVSKPLSIVLFSSYSGFFLMGMAVWYGIFERNRGTSILLACGGAFAFLLSPELKMQWPVIVPISALVLLLLSDINGEVIFLTWVGRISYPLYLLHEVLGLSVISSLKKLHVPDWACVIFVFAFCLFLAWLVHRFVEERSQKAALGVWRAWRSRKQARLVVPATSGESV
jgi:peptidoglycan/LPS O-acetylase OafA/YrhL